MNGIVTGKVEKSGGSGINYTIKAEYDRSKDVWTPISNIDAPYILFIDSTDQYLLINWSSVDNSASGANDYYLYNTHFSIYTNYFGNVQFNAINGSPSVLKFVGQVSIP